MGPFAAMSGVLASWALASGGDGCVAGAVRESTTVRLGIVLACGRAPDRTRVALVARDRSCLVLQGLPAGERACGVAPSRRAPSPLSGPVFVRVSPRARTELYGEASAAVRRVVVRFRHRGRRGRRRASLLRTRVGEPFGYFVAFVPAAARDVVAEGYGAGRRLGSLRFDAVLRSLPPRVFISAAGRPGPR